MCRLYSGGADLCLGGHHINLLPLKRSLSISWIRVCSAEGVFLGLQMHRGYIKLWRKVQDSKHFSRSLAHVGLFDMMLILANWKTGFFCGHKILPGQFATSAQSLAKRVGETRAKIRRLLKDLSEDGLISTNNVANRFTIITILNWETYQGQEPKPKPTKEPTTGQLPATIKEGKEGKEEIEAARNFFHRDWNA